MIEALALPLLRRLDPERAHWLSIRALSSGIVPMPRLEAEPALATHIGGLKITAPLGLAAGYDKNAEAVGPLTRAGFGFVEVGAATPLPQEGNPRPRLFRLTEDRAVINRFGFNNEGVDAVVERLARARRSPHIPVGLNLGANKTSVDRARDYGIVLKRAAPVIDFATVNVSSPNTENLRDLQGPEALRALLEDVAAVRAGLVRPVPLFLKIAPDLDRAALAGIAAVAEAVGVDAIIATNTTTERPNLRSRHGKEAGGLSGAPLFERSTEVLRTLARQTPLPLIGVGGIATAEQAYAKIRAGASALQLYSALVYGGLSLVRKIHIGLAACLARDGFMCLSDAVGADLR